jgi:methylglutaconyl-CoA hydratase
MRRSSTYGEAENMADARALAILMKTLHELPKPTVARVNGAALGGGAGLVACCDIAVASADARFGTTEVRLGLIPAVIGPYVVAAIGLRQARRLMLTGERIAAAEAARIGLVHDVVPPERLDAAVAALLEDLLKGGPGALAAVKRLLRDLTGRPIDVELVDDTARRIAALRTTAEAQEGVAAFLAKRQPVWLS